MRNNTAQIVDIAAQRAGDIARLKRFYSEMTLIRTVEQTLLDLFSEGLLRGTVHTCLGQEAGAVGLIDALDKERDIVCSNHRGHGHYLAYCADIEGLIAEVMGLPQGVCGGIGGSQHLHRDNFYSNGILGGMSPVATGFATAEKTKESGAVTVVFHGDGAMAEGAVYESLNLAALWQLPILFAVESNQYAQSTPIENEIAGSFPKRADAFGLTSIEVDGNDVLTVNNAAQDIVHNIRNGHGPAMMVLNTYRMGPHSKGDDDRDPQEIESHRINCPITRATAQLDSDWCESVNRDAKSKVAAIVASLKASKGRSSQ